MEGTISSVLKPTSLQAMSPRQTRRTLVRLVLAFLGLILIIISARTLRNDWWNAAVLGLVQGLTEFLPISSTGHLLIVSDLLRFQSSIGGTFEIFIQLGTVLAVAGYYARDLLGQARALPSDAATRRFWLGIVVAFVPAAIFGLLLRDWIKQVLFESPMVIASSLIIGGIVFLLVERLPQQIVSTREVTRITLRQALGVGVSQVLALIPGVSRSGASIVGGMLSGLDRKTATAFSFYLAIPTLGAATVVDLLASLGDLTAADIGRLAIGAIVAMVIGWFSIAWLLRYVANHSFVVFGYYRIIVGVVILALVAAGGL